MSKSATIQYPVMAEQLTVEPIRIGRRTLVCGALGMVAMPAIATSTARPALRVSEFAALEDALAKWAATGGTLLLDRDATLRRPATLLLEPGLSYELVAPTARTWSYEGPPFHWAVCLYSSGRNQVSITGPLTIDGRSRVSMPFFARFESVSGTSRRDFLIDGLRVRNARMAAGVSPVDGSATNSYGATGIALSGGFDRLVVRNVEVTNVTRSAGAGRPGSQGSAGISISGTGSTNPRHVLVERFKITKVDSEDAATSVHRGDMDGVLVFQAAERSGTRPIIQDGEITDAAGRAIKVFAPGGGGLTQNLTITRSLPGGRNGSIDIAHQHGDGVVRNIRFRYSRGAHANGTTTIGFSSGTAREAGFPFGPAIVENISIEDTTGVAKRALFGLQYNVPGDPRERSFSALNVTDSGRTQYLFLPGALGTNQRATITFSAVDVNIDTAVLASEDPTQNMALAFENVRLSRNPGRSVPLKVSYDDRPVPAKLAIRAVKRGTVVGVQ